MKRTILVAEDEASIREFVVINLKNNDYEVIQAGDGLEAWELYQQNASFSLVLSYNLKICSKSISNI